jgi:hypothetical protein
VPHKLRTDTYLKKFPDRTRLYKDGPDRIDRILRYNQQLLIKN